MKRIITGIIICFLFANCNKKKEIKEVNIPYIISENNKRKIIRANDTIPPPPPIPGWLIYGTNTFIIDNDSTVYYFQRPPIGFICGTETADTIPEFINLQPKDIIAIPTSSIADFVKINYSKDYRNITFIASKSDTLKSKVFFSLKKAIELSIYFRDSYYIRKTTIEEDTVVKYKKENEYYDSKTIKWDKTKITFPETINFIKRPN